MQVFFLKNMVAISIAALLFGGISLRTIAEQTPAQGEAEPAPSLREPINDKALQSDTSNNTAGSLQEVIPSPNTIIEEQIVVPGPAPEEPKPTEQGKGESVADDLGIELYEEMLSGETNTPIETPESRALERLEMLEEFSPPKDMTETPPSQATEDPPSQADEGVMTEIMIAPLTPEPSAEAPTQILTEDAGIQEQNIPAVPSTEGNPAVSEVMIGPDGQLPPVDAPNAEEVETVPTRWTQGAIVVKPKQIAWDDEEHRREQPTEDPNGPLRLPQGKGGRDKGQHFLPQSKKSKIIPIIRMGEDYSESNGFKIIKAIS